MIKTNSSNITGSLLVGQAPSTNDSTTSNSVGGGQANLGGSAAASAGPSTTSQRTTKEKPYFIMRDEHKVIYSASANVAMANSGADSECEETTANNRGIIGIGNVGKSHQLNLPGGYYLSSGGRGALVRPAEQARRDDNQVSFAKCLLLVYEKAINVQFMDYMDKM